MAFYNRIQRLEVQFPLSAGMQILCESLWAVAIAPPAPAAPAPQQEQTLNCIHLPKPQFPKSQTQNQNSSVVPTCVGEPPAAGSRPSWLPLRCFTTPAAGASMLPGRRSLTAWINGPSAHWRSIRSGLMGGRSSMAGGGRAGAAPLEPANKMQHQSSIFFVSRHQQ